MLPHQCQGWGDCCWIVFNICQNSFLNSRDVTKNANNYDGNVQELTSSSKKCAQSDLISHLRSYKSGLEQKKVWRQKTSQLTQNTQVVHREAFDVVRAQWPKRHDSVSDYRTIHRERGTAKILLLLTIHFEGDIYPHKFQIIILPFHFKIIYFWLWKFSPKSQFTYLCHCFHIIWKLYTIMLP